MNWLKKFINIPVITNITKNSNNTSTNIPIAKYYNAHGFDLSPNTVRKLTLDQVSNKYDGLRKNGTEVIINNDSTLLLYFTTSGQLFEAIISPRTTSQFLGMGMPQPEKVWAELGYRLQENLGGKVTWTNDDTKIVAYYSGSSDGYLNEIHYIIPEQPLKSEEETMLWRELGYFNGGDGCILRAYRVSGMCYADEISVKNLIKYVKEEWKSSLPQGFWLVEAEANDTSSTCRYWLGYDAQYETIWQEITSAIKNIGRLPQCISEPFSLRPNDLCSQTLVGDVHIRGFLKH
jgi:hypothetical protein